MTSPSLHGWLIINKPLHVTSNTVVTRVRRALNVRKVGHAGTLDPLATGVLPIAIGEATKTMTHVLHDKKRYQFTIQFGEQRTTDDQEGNVIATSDHTPTLKEIEDIIPNFLGKIEQKPPIYSAIHIQGKRAYARAREGENFELPARPINIYELTCLNYNPQLRSASFATHCSKGTYIRSLARDIALALDTRGFISTLQRDAVGHCHLDQAIPLDLIEDAKADAVNYLLPPDFMLDDIPVIEVSSDMARLIRFGQTIHTPHQNLINGEAILLKENGHLLAFGTYQNTMVKPSRVFNI